jgi:hypothetical protein
MPERIVKEDAVVMRFGGGLNTSASEDEINPRDAADGQNFILDIKNSAYRNRPPFDLLGTAPNAGSILGFANLQKTDGTVSMLVQAGTAVYEWDGTSFSASKGTVASGTKLRGHRSQSWQLSDKVIIADLALAQPVMEWDGTTLQNITFTDEDGSTAFGTFRAKYCIISNERAVFANIHDNGTNFEHLIVGSKSGDYTQISTAQVPSSALGLDDPFYLIQPDYRAINGLQRIFGTTTTSSKYGELFQLNGSSARDFAFSSFYPESGASSDESLVFIGTDIFYGKQGRIESLIQSQRFGDVEENDSSIQISDKVEGYKDWTLVYNSRLKRVYCFDGQGNCWVYFKSLAGASLSPWSRWLTTHSSSMTPTATMSMLDPVDGLEYVYFGDSSGNFYRMEGTGSSDGGTATIKTSRTSASFKAQLDAEVYNLDGWVTYRSNDEVTLDFTFLFNGENVFDESISLTLPATSGIKSYGGGYYYSDENYYSESLIGRLSRQTFTVPTGSNEFQVKITYTGTGSINIQEIGLRFETAS